MHVHFEERQPVIIELAQLAVKDPCSIVWLVDRDPYACRDRFFVNSRAGKRVDVFEMVAWEVDYLRLLFPTGNWSWVDDIHQLGKLKPDVVVFLSNTFTLDNATFRDWSPRILVYMSDEWGLTPQLHRLTTKIPLVLRPYHHPHYVHASNVRQIPLGFMNAMFDDLPSTFDLPLPSERTYRWCFVGTLREGRREALQAFESWLPSFQRTTKEPGHPDPCPPHELAKVYQNSTFALCPRGNVVMDCYRNYEATICGAIPVLAGCSKREFRDSFAGVNLPPWVHARTWREARAICEDLVKTGAVYDIQRAGLQWWRNEITVVRAAIADALMAPLDWKGPATVRPAPLLAVLQWKLRPMMRRLKRRLRTVLGS